MIFRVLSQLFMVTALGTVACSKSGTVTRKVAGHTFNIPRKYLVDATVFYLPASQKRSLRFVINPTAPLPQQNMVSIHPDATCPPIDASQPRDPRCRVIPIPIARLKREDIQRVGDDVWWEYRFENGGELVANCSALEEGEGLCTHYGLYESIPYELGLRDSQIGDLIDLRREVEGRLAEWELR